MIAKAAFVVLSGVIIIGGILIAMENRRLLKEGERAPDFTARLNTGALFSLAEHRGKHNIVLFFYPKDFTYNCTKEVCSFRDNYDVLKRYDAVLVGISYDDAGSHQAFIAQHRLPFPLISDTDKSIARAYGAQARFGGLFGGAKRVTYVIDKKGVIRSVVHSEVFVGEHVAVALEVLKKLEAEEGSLAKQ